MARTRENLKGEKEMNTIMNIDPWGFLDDLLGVPFREVSVVLQDDAFSAEVHLAVNGAEGPTDAITQRYDPMPGEPDGIYGEVYVNCDRALSAAPRRAGWSAAKELLLYVAHGMDHLSGADDHAEADYNRMRRRELKWLNSLKSCLA